MIDTETVLLQLRAMLKQEAECYTISDFFRNLPTQTSHGTPVDSTARRQITQWLMNIMEACNYEKEYAAITMSLLDRYVSTSEGYMALLCRTEYQKAALAALYLSVKVHCPQVLSPDLVAKLSQGSFNRTDVEDMEKRILFALRWRVNPPTTMDFVRSYLDMIPSDSFDEEIRDVVRDLASLQANMAVLDARFIATKASHVAFGSLMNAVESVAVDDLYFFEGIFEILTSSSGIDPSDVQEIRCQLYEAITDESSMEVPAARKAAFHRRVSKKMRRESFIESPRSVVEHDECLEH